MRARPPTDPFRSCGRRMVNVSDEGLEEVTMDDLSPGPRPLDLREVSENVATRAESAGAEAAEAVVTEMGAGGPAEVGEGRRFGSMGVPGAGGWPFQLNTLMERGLRVSLGEEGSDGALAVSGSTRPSMRSHLRIRRPRRVLHVFTSCNGRVCGVHIV